MELSRLTVLNERFAIRSVLGELGPFEATYLAWDLENEEQVIIREYLPVDLASRDEKGIGLFPKSKEAEQLFQYGLEHIAKEAGLFSNINHPNVVREREYFHENGTIYRILDYHAGASLAYVLQQQGGKVAPRTAVTILMPLMDGIRAGHMQGLVHGAISPEKIYLTKMGRPMLLSFKTTHLLLAQRTHNLESFQQPGFSPPEQYTPRGKHGPWSDVYGCGATLYTMLSGKQLPDVPARLREDIVPALIDQAFELSLPTRNALKTALDMNIKRRPQTIEAFRTLLIDGFKLTGAHVPPPDEQPIRDSYRPQPKIAATQSEPDDRTLALSETPEPLHFAHKGKASFSTPVVQEPLSVEQLRFDGSPPQEDSRYDDGSPGNGGLGTTTSLAEQFETSIAELGTVPAPITPVLESKPAIYDRKKPILEESWEKSRDYAPGRKLELQRNNRKRIFIGLAVGGILSLSILLFNYIRGLDPVSYEISNSGYSTALLKGDSLYTLAEDVMKTDSWESARLLFTRARDFYSVALTLSDGDKKTLRQRIDSVDAYLSVPINVELDEKESLAYISRGDSVMRVADALNIVGDSVEARSLYMQAREEYLKVLEVRPDDSLANARVREASQRMVTPVRAQTLAPPVSIISEGERRQQLYLQLKMQGDSAFDARSLSIARAKFVEALTYKPDDPHASRRILQIDQRLAASEREGQYRQYMNSGNRLKGAGRLIEAKREFEFALQFKTNDDDASAAIFAINTLLDQRQKIEDDYLSHKTRGEVLLEKEDYQKALESFQSALVAKPEDEYASLKLKEIRETLSSLAKEEKELPEGMVDDNGIYNFTEEPPVLVGGREVLQSRLRYPPKAVEAGIEGRISVRMIVDETGRMLNPTIQKGIRFDLDGEVLRVIRGARFEPGRVGGQPVKSWYTLFFEFKLDTE